jgi:hypothetical protein
MPRAFALALSLLVGLAACRSTTAPPKPDRAAVAATANADAIDADGSQGYASGASDAFRASLYLVGDPGRFVAAIRSANQAVQLPVVSRAARGQEIVAFISTQECAAGDDGLCDVVVDFELRDSSGELKAKQTDVGLWRDPPEPVPGTVLFGEAALTMTIAADARTGIWKLTARVTDRAASDTVTLRATLQVE